MSGDPSTSRPLVSIMMPMYNAERHVASAVASMCAQTITDWELLALDDGSSDGTAGRVRAFEDPRIRLITDNQNRGLPFRLNQAIEMARAPFLARMDADDLSWPERLETQLEFLTSHPSVDVVATDMLVIDGQNRPVGREKWRGSRHEQVVASPWSGFHFNHATWLGRAAWFRRFGYREDAVRTEDDDLMLRAYRSSRFHRIPQVLYAYRVEDLLPTSAWTARRYFMRSLWREAARQGTPRLLAGIPGQLAKAVGEWAADRAGMGRMVTGHRSDGAVSRQLDDAFRRVLERTRELGG